MFKQITVDQLARNLDTGEDCVLIDTRPEDSYEAWHVPTAVNLPFGPVEQLSDDQRTRIERMRGSQSESIVTICGKGITSTNLAAELDASGYDDVAVVKGGMRDWNARYERTTVEIDTTSAIFIQFQRRAKGCLSYLIGSQAGEAVVVDPTRHVDQYIVAAAEADLEITRVLDTHIHADHLSGGRELADRLGVPYHLGEHARDRGLEYEFQPLADGETLHLGNTELTALYAPGHTSEMMVYRIDGAILTGDALFVDSIGRTELEFGEESAETGARLEYETLHETLFEQPEELTVLPGHVTVTNDGYENSSPGEPISAILADVRDRLDVPSNEEAFVEDVVSNSNGEKPANYEEIIERNRGVSTSDDDVTLETGPNNCAA